MSLLEGALWLQSTDLFTALRLSAYVYPVVMTLHLVGIGLFGGAILITDLRLLGVGMRQWPVADMIQQLRMPKRVGLLMVATCGILLFGSKAEEYYYNIFFRAKLVLLALVVIHAFVFRGRVYGNGAKLDQAPRMPGEARLAAALSLLLWISLVIAGRGIGYIETPPFVHAKHWVQRNILRETALLAPAGSPMHLNSHQVLQQDALQRDASQNDALQNER